MALKARILLERATRWLLRNRRRPLDIEATIARYAPGASALADALPALVAAPAEDGVPAALAARVAHLEALVPSLDIVEIAESAGLDAVATAGVYYALGDRLELNWLRDRIVALSRATRWDAMARAALRDDVYAEQSALTAEVVRAGGDVDAWLAGNAAAVERSLQVLADIRTAGKFDLARLSVAVRELRNLIASSGSADTSATPAGARQSP
jgi:glutamate dehydrogenase